MCLCCCKLCTVLHGGIPPRSEPILGGITKQREKGGTRTFCLVKWRNGSNCLTQRMMRPWQILSLKMNTSYTIIWIQYWTHKKTEKKQKKRSLCVFFIASEWTEMKNVSTSQKLAVQRLPINAPIKRMSLVRDNYFRKWECFHVLLKCNNIGVIFPFPIKNGCLKYSKTGIINEEQK